MPPPMSMTSAIFIRFSTTSILSLTFAPPMIGYEWPGGIGDRFAEIGELFFHQQARGGLLHEVRDADDGRVGAVSGAEGVTNEEAVAKRGNCLEKASSFFSSSG